MEPIILKFKHPILFDGETFTECDLSGLRGLTTAQLYAAQVMNASSLTYSHQEGMNLRHAMTVAQLATGRPRGFFGQLKRQDALLFAAGISRLLQEITNEHVKMEGKKLKFDRSVEGLGKALNLRGLDGLVADDFAAAQDEIPAEEAAELADAASVKYACTLAAMITLGEKETLGERLEKFMVAPFWVGLSVRSMAVQYFFGAGSETDETSAESESETS